MQVTIKRAGTLAILAAGSASGAAHAQTFTDTFNYALDVRQPVNGAQVATSQTYNVTIGALLGQTTSQYTFYNSYFPGGGPVNPEENANLAGSNGATAFSDKSQTYRSTVQYGVSPFSDNALATGATPLQFAIGGVAYNGNANYIYDAGAQVFTLNTVTYALAPGVPEPAAWLTMIAGFGIAGAASRRRRRCQADALAA